MELTKNLAVRDVETRYKRSLLGLYWALINPLVIAAIYGFVFGVIFHATSKPIPYPVYLITGITFWNLFANGLMSATSSVSGNASLLAKLYFPRVVLPTAAILARLIDFLFSVVILLTFILIYHVPIHWTCFWLIPLLMMQMVFTFGIGYMLAALNVLYRDMNQLIALLIMVWMYFVPVMYTLKSASPMIKDVLLINPMGAIIQAERDVIFTGHLTEPIFLWTAGLWSALTFVGGLVLFKKTEPLFSEVM
jgi:ABC-2 type transport system permease protein